MNSSCFVAVVVSIVCCSSLVSATDAWFYAGCGATPPVHPVTKKATVEPEIVKAGDETRILPWCDPMGDECCSIFDRRYSGRRESSKYDGFAKMLGDDFGHLIAAEYGGADDFKNGVPMNLVLNQMVYRKWETEDFETCLELATDDNPIVVRWRFRDPVFDPAAVLPNPRPPTLFNNDPAAAAGKYATNFFKFRPDKIDVTISCADKAVASANNNQCGRTRYFVNPAPTTDFVTSDEVFPGPTPATFEALKAKDITNRFCSGHLPAIFPLMTDPVAPVTHTSIDNTLSNYVRSLNQIPPNNHFRCTVDPANAGRYACCFAFLRRGLDNAMLREPNVPLKFTKLEADEGGHILAKKFNEMPRALDYKFGQLKPVNSHWYKYMVEKPLREFFLKSIDDGRMAWISWRFDYNDPDPAHATRPSSYSIDMSLLDLDLIEQPLTPRRGNNAPAGGLLTVAGAALAQALLANAARANVPMAGAAAAGPGPNAAAAAVGPGPMAGVAPGGNAPMAGVAPGGHAPMAGAAPLAGPPPTMFLLSAQDTGFRYTRYRYADAGFRVSCKKARASTARPAWNVVNPDLTSFQKYRKTLCGFSTTMDNMLPANMNTMECNPNPTNADPPPAYPGAC